MTDEQDFVRAQLANAMVEMPAEVTDRLVAALAQESRRRGDTDLAAAAKADFVEQLAQASRGTFGTNPPRAYDRKGVGIHDQTARSHAERQFLA